MESNIRFAKRLNTFPEYIFSELSRRTRDVERKTGRKVLNLGVGSPDLPPSRLYVEKLKELIDKDNAHLYPGYYAIPEFSEALVAWYRKRFGVILDDDELLPLLGAKDGVSHIALAVLDPGDEILVPDPGYPGFSGPAQMVGAKPVFYNLTPENSFKISINELKTKVSPRTKAIWVNFPSNPTGQVATIEDLVPVVRYAQERNIIVIYDNAYSEITFGEFTAPSILQVEGARNIAVEIGSFSKTFSFAGYRMGWIVGNRQVVAALAKIKAQMDSGLSLPLQQLGAFSLVNTDQVWYQEMIKTYQGRRDIIAWQLKKLGLAPNIPQGSLYLWAEVPSEFIDSEQFSYRLLEEKQILVTPGAAFGKNGEKFIRASISVNTDRIEDYFRP